MSNLVCNIGDLYQVTPVSGEDISVTIGDVTYSTDSAADVATTIDNFIKDHGFDLNQIGILASDGSTTLDLYGVGGRSISSANTLSSSNAAVAAPFDVIANAEKIASADNVLRYTVSTGGNNTATVTLEYFDNASREEDFVRVIAAQGRGDAIVRPASATKATRS